MTRIISDTYIKGNKKIWGNDPNTNFNQRILAVNNMYGWLYEKGILEKAAFAFKDYEGETFFALNARDLIPYRKEMEDSQVAGAALAVRHIFDETYSPCVYSGAIELGWTMNSYRDVDGCVGSSWECGLIKCLNTEGIYEIAQVRDEQGVEAAVKALFAQFDWNLTLPEQKRYLEALAHFNKEANADIENEYVKAHARELIYCYDNKKTLIDFDFWTRYETLCGEKFIYDEYIAIDKFYDGDPHDISEANNDLIKALKGVLEYYRNDPDSFSDLLPDIHLYTCFADKGFKFLVKAIDLSDAEKTGGQWYSSTFFEPGHFSCWKTEKEDLSHLDTGDVIESTAYLESVRAAARKPSLNSVIQSAFSHSTDKDENTASKRDQPER